MGLLVKAITLISKCLLFDKFASKLNVKWCEFINTYFNYVFIDETEDMMDDNLSVGMVSPQNKLAEVISPELPRTPQRSTVTTPQKSHNYLTRKLKLWLMELLKLGPLIKY